MKNVHFYKCISIDWRIIFKQIDTAELSPDDHQGIYLVYVQDGSHNNIEAVEAYGIEDRNRVTKALAIKYVSQGIEKIEHED